MVRLAAGPVITTNFDHVLERVFDNARTPFDGVVLGARAERIVQAFHANRRFLLKIHGDAEEAPDRILTLEDYRKHCGGDDASSINWALPLPRLLELMLMSRPCLFLGCSLNCDRTTEVLSHIAQRYPEIAHYAVVEQPRSSKALRAKAGYLSERGIRPIWYPHGRHDLIEPLLAWLAGQAGAGKLPEPGGGPVNRLLSGPDDPLLQHRTGFFGRSVEVEIVVRFLVAGKGIATVSAAPEVCNVKGAPGIGKTEICKQALKEYLTAHPPQPAYYVQLVEAKDERGFLARLGEALGAGAAVNRQQVLDAVRARPGLIYLDNLEDVVADQGSRELLGELAAIPGVLVLASSRETLPGLARNIPIQRLPADSAVLLFLQEWERSGASVALADSPELRDFVEEELDCHALSIVLTAAQGYRHASLAALCQDWRAEALELAKLPRGPENPLSSLEVSLSRSLDAATREIPQAAQVWGLVTLFPEGMSPAAWQQVVEGRVEDAAAIRELLVRLNVADVTPPGGLEMLAPLRQFVLGLANERRRGLNAGTLAEVAYPYFLALAREAEEHLRDDLHTETLDALLAEFANLHHFVLFAAALAGDWTEKLSNLSRWLLDFYQYRVLLGEEMLRRLLELQRSAGATLSVAQSACYLGDLERRLGKLGEAEGHYGEAISLYRQERDNLGLFHALTSLGDLERHLRKLAEAEGHYGEAIGLYRQEGYSLGLANALTSLGDLESDLGKLAEAEGHYGEAIGLYRQEGYSLGLANALQARGDLKRMARQYQEAREFYIQVRELYVCEREPMGLAYTCAELARVAHAARDREAANRFIAEAAQAAAASHLPVVAQYVAAVAQEIGLADLPG